MIGGLIRATLLTLLLLPSLYPALDRLAERFTRTREHADAG